MGNINHVLQEGDQPVGERSPFARRPRARKVVYYGNRDTPGKRSFRRSASSASTELTIEVCKDRFVAVQ
jgi:hypothetical protein